MATISENLQTIANSTAAIKQAIIDKGGDVSGDITTWASAISGISGGGSSEEEYVFTGTMSYGVTEITISGYLNKIPDNSRNYLLILGRNPGGLCYGQQYVNNTGSYTLTVDFMEPISSEIPAICILNIIGGTHTIIPVKFEEEISTDPT